MESYQALYYPYAHFKDDGWVKLSALYWDKLKRIVPGTYPTDDSETVRALGPFIETLRPEVARPDFAQTLAAFFEAYGEKLRPAYSLEHIEQWPEVPVSQRPPLAGGPSGTDPRLGYVHYEKIADEVHQAMRACGLAASDGRGDPWIGMHPRIASVYMHALAEHIALHHGLRPLTDETLDHVAMSQLSPERLAQALLGDVALVGDKPSSTETEAFIVSLAFRSLVPADPAALSVDRILAFREAYPKERERFQTAVAGLLKSREWIANISDANVLEQRLHDEFDTRWTTDLNELKEKLRSIGIETMFGSANLTTALPSLLAGGLAAMAPHVNGLFASASAVALAGVPMMLSKRRAVGDELGKSPVAYLYRMEQDLQPHDLQARCRQRLRRFVFGA